MRSERWCDRFEVTHSTLTRQNMSSRKVYIGAAIAGLLVLLTILVFGLSIAIFVNVKENQIRRTNRDGNVPAPSSNGHWYSGELLDENTEWNEDWSNPTSASFSKQKSIYEIDIEKVLDSAKQAAYSNTRVIVKSIRGNWINSNRSTVRVEFDLGLLRQSDPSQITIDLQHGAQIDGFHWKNVKITNSGLQSLPEPDQSPGWSDAAGIFLESINTSVDPCQNFYRYSCDNYVARRLTENQTSAQSSFGELKEKIYKQLIGVLEKPINQPYSPQSVKMAVNMYKACVRNSKETYTGPHLILDLIKEYGGWPILQSDWDHNHLPHNVYNMMGNIFTKHGVSTLLSPDVDINVKTVTSNILYLYQANLIIPSPLYNNPNFTEKSIKMLRDQIEEVFLELGGNLTNDTSDQMDRMVEIEVNLANISVDAADQRNQTYRYNPYTINDASSKYSTIKWDIYFKGLLESIFTDKPEILLNLFIITEPSYMEILDQFMKKFQESNVLKDMVNYLIFRVIGPYLKFASPKMAKTRKRIYENPMDVIKREIDDQENSINVNETQEIDGQRDCVEWLVNNLPFATGRIYVDSKFPMENRDDISVMMANILSSFSSTLSGLDWMDDQSRLNAYTKVMGVVKNVAYPDFQQDDAKLDQYYDGLIKAVQKINPENKEAYFEYYKALRQFDGPFKLKQLKEPGNRLEFGYSPAIINAWYNPTRNSISFPAAILNPPFYRYDFPRAVNYGGIGSVIGHELVHGFDDGGVQFDANGTLHTWMTPHAQSGFQSMAQCVIDEYSQFCYPQGCINGKINQGENIADNGGMKASYYAYMAYVNAHGQENPLPGMETYNMEQIFFLSYAQTWCGLMTDEQLAYKLLLGPHSPGKDRVNGAVRNFDKFAETFQCKLGDPMYPEKTCDVW